MPLSPVGTKLYYDELETADPANEVGFVTSISHSGDTFAIYELTDLADSTGSKIAGRRVPGTLTFECYFHTATTSTKRFTDILGLEGTTKVWKVLFGNTEASTYIGDAIVNSVTGPDVSDDVIRYSVTLEKTGAWTFTE